MGLRNKKGINKEKKNRIKLFTVIKIRYGVDFRMGVDGCA
jgi:hypothetical protein